MFKNVGACCSIVCVVRARSAVIRACPVSAASKKWDSSHLPLSLRLQVIHDNGGDPPVWLQTTRSLIYLSKVVPWLVSPCFCVAVALFRTCLSARPARLALWRVFCFQNGLEELSVLALRCVRG